MAESRPRRIILDCDPGHDDAIAMLLAWGAPRVELAGVTTVSGNQSVEKVTRNALGVARIAGIVGVPFAAGAARALVRQAEHAPGIHGDTGLDGPALPEPAIELDERSAVQLIVDTVMGAEPGEITLVPTGALTNIALAARVEPRIVPRVREVVLMGGGVHEANWNATSEYNIVIDPEAAHIVFGAGWPVTMVGLDVTHRVLATPDVRERIAAIGTTPARFVVELLDFFGDSYRREQGFEHPPVHDPCAVAYAINPGLFETVRAPITVELSGAHTLGMTVADLRRRAPTDCVTSAAVGVDADGVWALIVDALARIGEPG